MPNSNKLTIQNYPEFSKKDYRHAFLNLFKSTTNSDEDPINMKIWGILTQKQKSRIGESLSHRIRYTSKEVKENILTILKLRDSLNSKKNLYQNSIERIIKSQSKNIGLGLEFFLWDALERNTPNEDINYEKPGYHLDQYYCSDLCINFIDNHGNKRNIGIDLSLTSDSNIKSEKTEKARKVNGILENGIDDYSSKRSPTEIGTLFINRKLLRAGNNCFSKALEKFYSAKKHKGGPSKYLEEGIQKRINKFSQILVSIFKNIQNDKLENYKHGEFDIIFHEKEKQILVHIINNGKLLCELVLNKQEKIDN